MEFKNKGFSGLINIADTLDREAQKKQVPCEPQQKEQNTVIESDENVKTENKKTVNFSSKSVNAKTYINTNTPQNMKKDVSENSSSHGKDCVGMTMVLAFLVILLMTFLMGLDDKPTPKVKSNKVPKQNMKAPANVLIPKQTEKKSTESTNNKRDLLLRWNGKKMYITGSEVRMRDAASLNSTAIDKFDLGEEVLLLGISGRWCKVQRDNGDIGYVHCDYCKEILITQRVAGTYISGIGVRARSGPGTRNPIIGEFEDGESVKILNRSGEWYKVQREGGQVCWVFIKYVETD